MRPFPICHLFVTALFVTAASSLQAQDDPNVPAPTVTKEMGDVGGKIFGKAPDPAKTRHYYIAAEPELWNFAPQGSDPVCGLPFSSSLLLNRVSWKIRYVQYADPEFTARVLPSERLGILGPVLRGTTGEYLAVTLLNRAWQPVSMHPHGVRYDKENEGSYYKPNPGLGSAIAPGAKFTYVWQLDEASGPRPDEPSSKGWLYHSHVAGDADINLGMLGFIVVTDPKRARPDGTPNDVDREMGALFTIFDESSASGEAVEEPDERPTNAPADGVKRTWAEVQEIAEASQRHTINGRTFENLGGLDIKVGERVRWYLFGIGSEEDFHTAHWHGERVLEEGRRRTDVVELLPGSMKTADMVADNPGSWLFHCHVAEHMNSGMFAAFRVHPAGEGFTGEEPENAFFGMPAANQTLRFQSAELAYDAQQPGDADLNLTGQVTVPDPYPTAKNPFVVQIGAKKLLFNPDASGLCASSEGVLVIKNSSLTGNGVVTGGVLNFDLTLKGPGWLQEWKEHRALPQGGTAAAECALPVELQLGPAHHKGEAKLKAVER